MCAEPGQHRGPVRALRRVREAIVERRPDVLDPNAWVHGERADGDLVRTVGGERGCLTSIVRRLVDLDSVRYEASVLDQPAVLCVITLDPVLVEPRADGEAVVGARADVSPLEAGLQPA